MPDFTLSYALNGPVNGKPSWWNPDNLDFAPRFALAYAPNDRKGFLGKLFGNAGGYSNPKVDELFEKGEQATGNEARGVFYRQVQAILADDLPVFTLHEKVVYDGRSKKVKGPRSDNYFYNSWRDNWLEP